MKHLLFIVILALLVSCSQQQRQPVSEVVKPQPTPKEIVKKDAENGLLTYIDEKYPHGSDAKPEITDRDVVMNDDSIYWMRFKMKYQNEFGGFSRGKFCYVYVLDYDGTAKRGLFNTDNDSESDFLFFLLHCQKVAVKKRKLPDSLVYGNKSFTYSIARTYCFLSGL